MRAFAFCVVASLCAACGQPAAPQHAAPPPPSDTVNAERVSRALTVLPPDYEVADVVGPSTPLLSWGLGPGWIANPPECAEFADVGADGATVHGWSASGPGGIVHAVVVDGARDPQPDLVASCPACRNSRQRRAATRSMPPPCAS